MRKLMLTVSALALAACGGASGKLTGKVVVTGGANGATTGVTVTAIGPTGGGALTDASGNFEIDNLADGNYSVSAVVPGTVEGEVRVFANVKGGKGDVPELKFNVPTPPPAPEVGTVSGKVTYSDGSDASGITVTLVGPGSQGTAAAMDGSYSFNNVAPGIYTLSADAAGSLEGHLSVAVEVMGSQTATVADLTFTAVGTVTGKATKAAGATGNAGISVSVAGTIYRATTADDGSYAISNVPAGMQTLIASLPDWDPASTQVAVTRGTVAAPALNLTKLTVHGTVSGVVAFSNNQDRSIITVKALGTSLSTAAQSDGRYTLQLPAGHFDIVADAPNFPLHHLGNVAVDDGTADVLPTVVLSPWHDFPAEPGATNASLVPTADGDHALYTVNIGSTLQLRMVDLRGGTSRTVLVTGGTLPAIVLSRHGRYVAFQSGSNWIFIDATDNSFNILAVAGAPTGNVSFFTSDEKYFIVGDGAKVHRFEVATATDAPLTGVGSADFRNDSFLVQDVGSPPYSLNYATATSSTPVATGVTKHTVDVSGVTVVWNNCSGNCALHLIDQATGTVSNPSGGFSSGLAANPAVGTKAWIDFTGTGGGFMNIASGAFTVKPLNFGTYAFNPTGNAVLYEVTGGPNTLHYEAGAPTGAGTTVGTSTSSFSVGINTRSGWLDDTRAIAFGNTPLSRYDIVSGTATPDTDIVSPGAVTPPTAYWRRNSDKKWIFADREYTDFALDLSATGSPTGWCESLDGKTLFAGGFDPTGAAYYVTKIRDNASSAVSETSGFLPVTIGVCDGPSSVRTSSLTANELLVSTGQRIDLYSGYSLGPILKSESLGTLQYFATQAGAVPFPAFAFLP